MTTQEVVEKYFAAVNAGDWDSWIELFDQNVVMEEQLEGHVEGIDALRGAVDSLKRGYSRFQNNPRKILVSDEDALIIWEIDAANASGVPVRGKGANHFVVKNGKITYMANYHDSVPFKPFTDQKFDE